MYYFCSCHSLVTATAFCGMEQKFVFPAVGRLSVRETDRKGNQACAIHSCGSFLGGVSSCKQGFPALREKCGKISVYLRNNAGGWAL